MWRWPRNWLRSSEFQRLRKQRCLVSVLVVRSPCAGKFRNAGQTLLTRENRQEDNVISVTSHQWGWVAAPSGASSLGTGDYAGVTVQDVILSSVSAYQIAGYDYNNITAYERVKSALEGQWANPGAQGPSWEGTFTIPVCDVSTAVEADYQDKQYILQPYNGDNSRPIWCGPICGSNLTTMQAFIAAAQMTNFDSPKHACTSSPGY